MLRDLVCRVQTESRPPQHSTSRSLIRDISVHNLACNSSLQSLLNVFSPGSISIPACGKGFSLYPATCVLRVPLLASPPHPPGRVNSSGQVQGLDKCCKLLPVLKFCFPALDFSLLLIHCICASYPLIIGAAFLGFPFWEVSECARSCASPVPAFGGSGMRDAGCGMRDMG